MKCWPILLCLLAVNLFPQPQNSPPKNQQTATDHTPHTVTFIDNEEPKAKAETAHSGPPRWYASSEWWLVIVAALTALFIGWQARETARAAQAMRNSVRLQEVQMRQWVDIEDHDVQCPRIQSSTAETELTISFQIVNPTEMLLTLKEITTRLFDDGPESSTLEYTLTPGCNYPLRMTVIISGESLRKYTTDVFIIPVAGLISFEDAFGRMQHHGFGFNCRCSQGKCEFTVYEGKIPKKESH